MIRNISGFACRKLPIECCLKMAADCKHVALHHGCIGQVVPRSIGVILTTKRSSVRQNRHVFAPELLDDQLWLAQFRKRGCIVYR